MQLGVRQSALHCFPGFSSCRLHNENKYFVFCYNGVETALMKITNDLLLCRDEGTTIMLVAIDTSSAFDCLDHNILLSYMSTIGIKNLELEWFKSYLTHRKQCVKISENLSETKNLTYRVPQGSLQGPILFNLYMILLLDIFTDVYTLPRLCR